MSNVLFVHDDVVFATARGELWQRMGFDVEVCTTARQCLQKISMGLGNIHTVIVHKDLGHHSSEKIDVDAVVRTLREEYEHVRLGIVSGEHPHGKGHVLSLEADFYFPTTLDADHNWLLKQLRSGYVGRAELGRRGKEVSMP